MKIFLSHSTLDGAFTKRLAEALKAARFVPWLCEVDVAFGDDFIHKINEGLADAGFILLIWSPEAAASGWTRKEWEAALHREVKESVTRLGVVKLRAADVPPLLVSKVHFDASKDEDEAIRLVVAAMEQHRAKLEPAAASAPRPVARRPEGFIGRGEYFDRLYTELVEREGTFLLHGPPGAGKSTIPLEALWRWRGRFERALFVTCGQRTASEAASDLAGQMNLDVRGLAPERVVATVREGMEARRALVVLDDVWHDDVAGLMPTPPASVLLTSRRRAWGFVAPVHALEVKTFSEDEAEGVFRLWLGEPDAERHRSGLLELARRWDRLPVAVVVAADLLRRQFGGLDEAARGLALAELRNGVHDVPALMRRAVEGLEPPSRRLLEAAAFCAADGFWLPLAVSIAGLSEAEGRAARDRLVNGSLMRMLDRDRQRFSVHAVLREAVRAEVDREDLAARHATALEALFEDGETRWRDCRECLVEVVPAMEWLVAKGELERMSSVANNGSRTAWRIGELEEAFRMLGAEETIWQGARKGGAPEELQRVYGNQALILKAWGRLEEAMALLKKQEAICLELGDNDSLQASYGNQAGILQDWGRLEEAMALHKKEEAICLELGNKNDLAISYGNQAEILQAWGRMEEAMVLHKKQEAICLELGLQAGLADSWWNQGRILNAQHQPAAAREKWRAALEIFTRLNMPRERDRVQADLDTLPKSSAAGEGQ